MIRVEVQLWLNRFLAVRIPPSIMEKLNDYVENTGTTKTEVIVGALAQYLDCTQDLSMPKRMAEMERKVAELEEGKSQVIQIFEQVKLSETRIAKKGQNKLSFWIKVGFIGASLPLLISHQSGANNCTKTEIESKIEQFKDVQKAKAARQAVVECGEKAIAPLVEALSKDEAAIRAKAASALGKMGVIAQDVSPVLVDTLEDREETVRIEALSALIQIGQAVEKKLDNDIERWQFSAIENIEAFEKSLEKAVGLLKEDKKQWVGKEQQIEKLRLLNKRLSNKLKPFTNEIDYQVIQWIKKNPWIVALPAGYLIVNLGIFIFRPTLLLKMDESVRQWTFSLTGKLRIPLPVFLKYHSWVLDAWVKQRITTARNKFFGRESVKKHEIHLPQPIILNEREPEEFKTEKFRKIFKQIFKQRQVRLVIWGEGGLGKTSLVCQIAEWALGRDKNQGKHLCKHWMLPIFIEDDIGDDHKAEQLFQTICGRLRILIDEPNEISEELVKQLMKQKRILVIVDHISELNKETQKLLKAGMKLNKYPVNALIITSRIKDILGLEITPTFVQPCRILGYRIAKFFKEYISKRGMTCKFNESDYLQASIRLKDMVSVTQGEETLVRRLPLI